MVAARHDYAMSSAEVRGAWHASIGATTEEEIRARANCSRAVAFRIACLRRAGTLRPLGLWLKGVLTLRQMERIVTTAPFDEEAQVEEATHASTEARRALAKGEG